MKTILCYIIILTSMFLISCKGGLNNEEAEKVILSSGFLPTEKFDGYKLYYDPNDDSSYYYKDHKKLIEMEIFKILQTKNEEDTTFTNLCLTETGKKYLSKRTPYNTDSSAVFLVFSVVSYNNTDSVITDKNNSNARAYFKFKHNHVTPIGKVLKGYIENGLTNEYVDFVKIKDQWELDY